MIVVKTLYLTNFYKIGKFREGIIRNDQADRDTERLERGRSAIEGEDKFSYNPLISGRVMQINGNR